ncbi:hypothetical protein HK103_007574 [Boothiomyces macroporosus]|uniref:Acyltransferase C-terminal domain-containing protein n=1 Tax=Boothiomyces macroporosus TaxID=261099 RepID=A0AAD5UCW1_9FUNG|nr:hypothetical protein HK103_007574 [Boothiomyces macroporosus]
MSGSLVGSENLMCFEFIFFARKWPIDSKRLQKTLTYAKNDNNPMWLLVFPEGTVITQDTQEKSRAFAKKNDITEDPKHVLLPKSTGLYHILRQMQKSSDYLYDFTIGYSGITENHCPYDEYPPTKVFFEHQGPKSIHIHVDRFKITEIPGIPSTSYDINEATPKEFELWLRRRFMEKDELMKGFYEDGYFPEKSVDGTGVKQSLHLNPANQDWISITGLVATSVMSLGWLFL